LELQVGASVIHIGKMAAPIPWTELEGPCQTSFLWPKAAEELRPHVYHLIVVASGKKAKIELARLLTQVIAAILGTCDAAIGVYWGSASLVIPSKIFREFAIEVLPSGPPIQIWVDFRVGKNNMGGSIGFTHGLDDFELMELETENALESPIELRDRLWSLSTYLLENGPVIGNGHSVGRDAKERIRVVYSPSVFGNKNQVMRLDYTSIHK